MTSTIPEPRFWDSFKLAFAHPLNLGLLGLGLIGAVGSGAATIALPVLLGLEAAYLIGLMRHPRFRDAVRVKMIKEAASSPEARALRQRRINDLVDGLDAEARRKYSDLKRRAERLIEAIANRHPSDLKHLQATQQDGLNRLLWIYLKLLYTQVTMRRFLSEVDETDLRASIAQSEAKLADLGEPAEDDLTGHRMARSLEDLLATMRVRLDNLERATRQAEFVDLERMRLEEKLSAMLEQAIRRPDPARLTAEVDGVADSMSRTEQAMLELGEITGLHDDEDETPAVLRGELDKA